MAYTDYTSKATGNWETEGQTTWNEVGHPESDDDATMQNTHTVSLTQNEACINVMIDAGGQLNIDTYNLVLSVDMDNYGYLDINASSDTGLTCVKWTARGGSTVDLNAVAKINISGKGVNRGDNLWTTNNRGELTITVSDQLDWGSGNNVRKVTQNVGVTTTLIGDTKLTGSGQADNSSTIYGIFVCSGYGLTIGAADGGVFIIGVNSDITGSGSLTIQPNYNTTYTNSKTTVWGFAGVVNTSTSAEIGIVGGNWANITRYNVQANATKDTTRRFMQDVIFGGDFRISSNVGYTNTLENNGNYDINYKGDIDFNNGVGLTVYTKSSTATATLGGDSTQEIDFDDKDIESIVIAGTGAKELKADFYTDSITGSGNIIADSGGTAYHIKAA